VKNVKIDRRPVTTITGVVSDMQEKIELREAEFESKTKQLAEGRRKLIELHPSRVHFQDLLWTTQFYQMYSGRCNGSPVIIKRINTTVTPEAFHTSRELLFPMGGVFHENLV
jgi:hypothetical protein